MQNGDSLGCFGKMPMHADFIRHRVCLRETVALDGWVQEGVSCLIRRYGNSWRDSCRHFPGSRFVFTGSEQERTLAGTLLFSQDRSGRPYPFVIVNATDEALFRQMQAVPPLFFAELFRQAEDLCREEWGNAPVSLLTDRLDSLCRPPEVLTRRQLLAAQIKALEGVALERFWNGVLPEAGAEQREKVFLLLFQILRQIAGRGPGRTAWGLRLPLPAGENSQPFVIFWLQMIEAILEDRHLRCHCFWNEPADQQAASLNVFFRPVPASYLLALVEPERHGGTLYDLLREADGPMAVGNHAELRQLLADPQAALLDLLYRFGRREVLL